MPETPRGESPLLQLRRLARRPAREPRCELCGAAIAPEAAPGAGALGHDHLIAPARREVRCVCASCAVTKAGPAGGEWRRIRRRAVKLADLPLLEHQWENLQIPIRVAFFVTSAATGQARACYPSPAGLTESALEPDAWREIVAANPVLSKLEPDTEALLVHGLGEARDHYLVSLDLALRLAGLVRRSWRGFTGGREVTVELRRFFAALEEEARSDPAATA